ncbi:hypothetical protein ACQCT3_02380 [Sutcliffiella horikoshii]|uniref:hypothetical protein n=1 Tax=Sutcliffiella horikoshii TaxID=79883 RepID=UPI003CE9435A
MKITNSFWLYIFLAGIREYRYKNEYSLNKFILFTVYSLLMMLVCFTTLYVGVNQHVIATILIIILSALSFFSVDFDNYISYCQNPNNKILLAYPKDYGDILLVNSFKYLFIHLFSINLGAFPFVIIFLYSVEGTFFFIIKFFLLLNILSIFITWMGWIKWIKKWQEVKLKKKAKLKMIGIVLSGIVFLIAINLVRNGQVPAAVVFNATFEKIKAFNQAENNFFNGYYYWLLILTILLLSFPTLKYIKQNLSQIYEFYIINNGKSNLSSKTNYLEKFLNSQDRLSISLKKEFFSLARNENVYNEILRKIKYSIVFMIILSIYFYLSPFTINFHTVSIIIVISITGYGDNVIRNFLPVSSEGRMIINYVQANMEIKKVLNNKVNMLFLYRQLFIIGPMIFAVTASKLNILDIIYFLILWIIVSYTTANIKIYAISNNSKFLTTEDFFKKMTPLDIAKYFALENSYNFLLFMMVLICTFFIPYTLAIVIGILWISLIYNILIFLLQGDGNKFYGEFKKYV